ncbi:MAG: L,D-transpeptidase [Methylocystis sp.]
MSPPSKTAALPCTRGFLLPGAQPMSNILKTTLFLVLMSLALAGNAAALVRIHIDLSNERMYVNSPRGHDVWKVSTARSGYHTPKGSYAPIRMQRLHYSRKYHAWMPYAIFFRGGYAIHGEYNPASIGRPVSHGCVRLTHLIRGGPVWRLASVA